MPSTPSHFNSAEDLVPRNAVEEQQLSTHRKIFNTIGKGSEILADTVIAAGSGVGFMIGRTVHGTREIYQKTMNGAEGKSYNQAG